MCVSQSDAIEPLSHPSRRRWPTLLGMTLTPEQRSQRGRLGAYRQQALYDTRETTRAARAAFDQRFVDQVDPERKLSEPERERRAAAARKAYFAALSLKASSARRQRAERHAQRMADFRLDDIDL